MRSNKKTITWCLKQKRGIKLVEPNPALCGEYLRKAEGSLKMLNAALERDEREWVAITAYYARYDAVYALFLRCGIVSEIHECTLAALDFFFADEGIVSKSLTDELRESKDSRIDAQYYVAAELDADPNPDAEKARAFVLDIEKVLDRLDEKTIRKIRSKF